MISLGECIFFFPFFLRQLFPETLFSAHRRISLRVFPQNSSGTMAQWLVNGHSTPWSGNGNEGRKWFTFRIFTADNTLASIHLTQANIGYSPNTMNFWQISNAGRLTVPAEDENFYEVAILHLLQHIMRLCRLYHRFVTIYRLALCQVLGQNTAISRFFGIERIRNMKRFPLRCM